MHISELVRLTMDRTFVDVLEISSPEKISVRLTGVKEDYFKFQDLLRMFCTQNFDSLFKLQPEQGGHCLLRRMSSWHRGVVLSTQDQIVRVRLLDAGQDQDFQSGDLFKLPEEFSLKEKGSFAEFVHLSQFPFSASRSCEIIESMRNIMSDVRSPYYIKRAELQFIEDRWSLPVELGWTETRMDSPLGRSYSRETCLSQILFKKGFAVVEEEFEERLLESGEDEEALSCLVEDNIDPGSAESSAGDPWTEVMLPTQTAFKARGTYVDDVGQIYMILYENRKKLREVRRQLIQLTDVTDLEERSDLEEESLTRLQSGQAILALYGGVLHRATFIKYSPASSSDTTRALVQYGDFGTLAVIDSKDIWKDTSNTRDIPLLAFRTVLANILPRHGGNWSNDAIDFIYHNIYYGNLKPGATHNNIKVQVLSDPSEEPLLVTIKLFTPVERAEWVDLSEILIKRGDAVAASQAEVNSLEQRRIRSELVFSRKSQRSEEERNIRRIYPVPPFSRSEERLPKMNLHLNGGDLVECKIVAQLRWDIVSVHLVNPETNNVNQKVYNLLEESPNFPVAEDPRFGLFLCY